MAKTTLAVLLILILFATTAFSDVVYPEINYHRYVDINETAEVIPFKTWSRNKDKITNKLPESVKVFTSNQIINRFLSKPTKYADAFWGTTPENYKEKVVFTLLYEPFLVINPSDEYCKDTWHYYLSVEPAPTGSSKAITELIISKSGNILYGLNVDPYSWEDSCPLDVKK